MKTNQNYLTPPELASVIGFLGYGNPSRSVWFIGFEEGLGNMTSADALWNLKTRGQFKPIMDLYEAHLNMRQNGQVIDVSKKPPTTQVWRWMAKLMIARGGLDWSDKQEAVQYVRTSLGRSSGETFLTELSPIPTRSQSDLSWAKWFKDHVDDVQTKIGRRQTMLKSLLSASSPQRVFCYGIGRKREFSELLGTDWHQVCPDVFTSTNSEHILLPFFGNGCMSKRVVESLLDLKVI